VARERPTASNVVPPADANLECTREGDPAGLTRAEARALRRSAPLTPAQFKAMRRRAEQGLNPLRQADEIRTDL
jgi:predicted nuclease with RNAse H fold